MRFIAFDLTGAEELSSDRSLQSAEFDRGRALGQILAGENTSADFGARINIKFIEDGIFILGNKAQNENLFVIDESSARLFTGRQSNECLIIIQKLCRFSIRYWKHLRLSRTEIIPQNSTKVIIFPFPISHKTSFRIIVEREPDHKRMGKRSEGSFLLAYFASDTATSHDVAPLSEFRRALKLLPIARAEVDRPREQSAPDVSAVHVTNLDAGPSNSLPPQQGFDRWMGLLTQKQRAFVNDPLVSPHRIEGPAGTGKTLCLALKAIHELRLAKAENREWNVLFIAHSEATRKSIQDLMDANDEDAFSHNDRYNQQYMNITTLHELCGKLLNTEILETEFLDRDAMESKNTQLLYVNEALQEAIGNEFPSYKSLLSDDLVRSIENDDDWTLSEMFQHEISVVIKGRADDDLNKYRKLPPLFYGLPIRSAEDRGFSYIVFKRYQEKLRAASQFDTDDVVLTAVGQLDTPIWRRRRSREGYNCIFVDETHLFNMNELSVFHYLTKNEEQHRICYSVDRSQSLGDRGWNDVSIRGAISPSEITTQETQTLIKSVFRCAPEIINLAFSVTSAGATLFTNFEDPLQMASSTFTEEEERKCAPPIYIECSNDQKLIEETFSRAEVLASEIGSAKCKILIVVFDNILFDNLSKYASQSNKPVEFVTRRGDTDVVSRAERSGRFVIGLADFVGGLEFDGVVLSGVDEGRLPPARSTTSSESINFLSYSAHNRLYVAITRARYRVIILGSKERGPSRLLAPALASKSIIDIEGG